MCICVESDCNFIKCAMFGVIMNGLGKMLFQAMVWCFLALAFGCDGSLSGKGAALAVAQIPPLPVVAPPAAVPVPPIIVPPPPVIVPPPIIVPPPVVGASARETLVGSDCYIARADDYLARENLASVIYFPTNRFGDSEQFIMAIEDKCVEYNRGIRFQVGEKPINARSRHIEGIKLGGSILQYVPHTQTINVGGSYYGVQRGEELKKYVELFFGDNRYKKLHKSISFIGEPGVDVGGLTRDFKDNVAKQIGAMFKKSSLRDEVSETFNNWPNCTAAVNGNDANQANCWENIGFAFAKLSFIEGEGVPYVGLPLNLLLQLQGKKPVLLEEYLAIMMLSSPVDFSTAMMTLKIRKEKFEHLYLALKDGTDVDDSNVLDYALECAQSMLEKPQYGHFVRGFHDVVGSIDISDLHLKELALLLEGNPTTVEDIIAALEFNGVSENRKTWLKEIIIEESESDPSFIGKLMPFWTGSSRLPGGDQKLEVKSVSVAKGNLPISHTCFFRIDLPDYFISKDSLKQKFIQAVKESGGFGII